MSSAGSAPPLVLRRKPSRRLAALLFAIHVAALSGLGLPMLIPTWTKAVLAALVVFSGVLSLRRDAGLRTADAVLRLGWSEGEQWWLETRAGARVHGRLREDSLVLPGLVILRLDIEPRGTRSVILPADGTEFDDLRRLRVRLRHEPALRAQA